MPYVAKQLIVKTNANYVLDTMLGVFPGSSDPSLMRSLLEDRLERPYREKQWGWYLMSKELRA